MRIKRWAQFERFWCTCKLVKPEQAPVIAPFSRNFHFIAGDVERCSIPTIGRFHLDQAFMPFARKAENIVAGTITIFLEYPANTSCQIFSAFSASAFVVTGFLLIFAP